MIRTALTLAALAAAGPAVAQDPEAGEAIYRTHCAACHGLDAEGNGPMAGVLTIKPTDLTALAAENDGFCSCSSERSVSTLAAKNWRNLRVKCASAIEALCYKVLIF